MRKIILVLILLMFFYELYAQAPSGEFSYRQWTATNDTLIVKRKYGDWWFGGRVGLNRNYYFGTLDYQTNNDPGNPFKRLVKFDVGDGGGAIYGGVIEYLPVGEKWGYGVNFNLFEARDVNSSSDPINDSLLTYYDLRSNLNYIVISPFARLNFLFPGLFTYSGLDVAINMSQNTSFLKKFQNSGFIEQWQKENFSDLPVSVGFHIGFGYDLFLADISEKARTRLTPFISLNMNSSIIGDNNSTWSGLQLKMGFAVKLGFDRIKYDTLYYDKDFVAPPSYLASAKMERGLEFDGFRSVNEFVGSDLATVDLPKINEEIKGKTDPLLAKDNRKTVDVNEPTKYKVGEKKIFSFSTSASTELSNELKEEIKKISEFLKANPNIKLQITGYSDNAGSLTENTQRSFQRAEKTIAEFQKKGVSDRQLPQPRGRGAFDFIADNRTEEGRRKNRRVEIIFTK